MIKESTNQRNVLGKGMAALFGDNLEKKNNSVKSEKSAQGEGAQLISPDLIQPNPAQPRKIFKESELLELAQSIKENGIIQPLVVAQNNQGQFELISGERRLRAAKLAGLDFVPIIIKKVTQKQQAVMGIIENVQREDLNCVESALAYFKLINDYKMTQEEIAKQVGKDRSTIANHLRLLKLPKTVIELLKSSAISFGHGKLLASLEDAKIITPLAQACSDHNWSVRELEDNIKKAKNGGSWDKTKEKPKSEGPNPGQFDHLKQKLERKTGFHVSINSKKSGAGNLIIHYNDQQELDKIYQYLCR